MRHLLSQGVACAALYPTLLGALLAFSPGMAAETATPSLGGAPEGMITIHEALLILDGNFYHDGIGGYGPLVVEEAYQPSLIPPFNRGALFAPGPALRSPSDAYDGFNLRAAELSFSATLTPYFDASIRGTVEGNGAVGLENAWLQTRTLPYGLRLRGGKFNSDFGYLNKFHPHDWDFVDQNLPYQGLLGESLIDSGLQFAWLPELPLSPMLGAELFEGNQEILGATLNTVQQRALGMGKTARGARLWTAFAKVAPKLGERQSLTLGLSYAHNRQQQELLPYAAFDGWRTDPAITGAAAIQDLGLAGNVGLWGLELVYKYRGGGAHGQGDFKFESEYLRATKHLDIRYSPEPQLVGMHPTITTDGLYAQAVYGFAPRWTAGVRYDLLGLTNQVANGPIGASFGASSRWTLDLTWNFWKTSKLRAQYASNDILAAPGERERFDAFYLQLLVELGKKEDEEG